MTHTKPNKSGKPARFRKFENALVRFIREIERAHGLQPQSLLQSSTTKPRLLTPVEASGLLGLSVKTLANLRSSGMADLPYRKIGSRVFYRRCDVLKYRKARKFYSTSEYPQWQNGGVK